MALLELHADARADVRERARSIDLERRLLQFQPPFRARVIAMARRHPRLLDLAASFPALLFALAAPRAGVQVEPVVARVIAGMPLRELARAAGVPLWLRGVKPKAFAAALPALPDGESFRRQIANYRPANPRQFATWVQAIGDVFAWADEDVALWIARELCRRRKEVKLNRLPGICLWAWYSRRANGEGLYAVRTAWAPAMAFAHALTLADDWLSSVRVHVDLSDDVTDMWLTPGVVDGYEFVPLRTAADIAEEAMVMKHCLADYGGATTHYDNSRYWSVRRDGACLGTLEIGFLGDDPFPAAAQMAGKWNKPLPLEVWTATRRWLNAHELVARRDLSRSWGEPSRAAWQKQWRPYWLAKRRFPEWLPLAPSSEAMRALIHGPRPRVRRYRY